MRPEILYPLFADISSLKGMGPKSLKYMENLLGGRRIIDLLFHLPSNIIDRSYRPKLKNAIVGKICTIKVKVVEHIPPKTKQHPYRVVVEDDTEQLTLIFFKVYADSIAKNLPIGTTKIVSGRLEKFNNQLQMAHPDFILNESEAKELPDFEPIYPLTAGITNKMISKFMAQAMNKIPSLPEWLDSEFLQERDWPDFKTALLRAHHPQNLNDLQPFAKERARLAYDELLANQLALGLVREQRKKIKGKSIQGNGALRDKIITNLPFKLTKAQEKVLCEIYADQASEYKMMRLLQGDVGSGKTIVALLAMLNAVEVGLQGALMAPTEILAQQHFETIAPLTEMVGIKTALLTGKTKVKERKQILENLNNGAIDIIIGTHALFQDDVVYHDLGLAIVDEQHRFGVQQRLKLSQKGQNSDVLVMTATPIPRTLVLSTYGDMDCSIIDQLPAERKPVDTRVMPLSKLPEVINRLKHQIDEGIMAYWVCPLVEESEKSDLAAAEARFADMKQIFGNQVGLVHGKMKEAEKNAVMEKFKNGDIRLLVATTVIEVGVNVPQATLMIIEHAERFGLAQLHQLRGRVKRGNRQAVCLLMYGGHLSDITCERLNIMKQTEDGFVIAEKDLELRGGGEILGTRQSGLEDFRLADMEYHRNLLLIAHKDTQLIINKDKFLQASRGQALRTLLYLFGKDENIQNYQA